MRCRPARPRPARGFTLVELLVALFALSLLALLSWRGLDGMTRSQAITAARADEVLALQTGLAQWSADLEAIVAVPHVSPLEWNGRVLRMTRRGTNSAGEGLRVAAWTLRDGQWLRWQSAPLVTRGEVDDAWQQADTWARNPAEALRRQEVAIGPLVEWQLFWFRGDSWTNPLSSDAQGGQALTAAAAAAGIAGRTVQTMPDGVRLVLVLPPGRALSGRIVRDWARPTLGGGKS